MTNLEELTLKYWNLYTVLDCEHASQCQMIEVEYSDKKIVMSEYLERLAAIDSKRQKALDALDRYLEKERNAIAKIIFEKL